MLYQDSKITLPQFIVRKRAVSYRRVSTDEQADKGFSLSAQTAEIEAYATRNGFEIVADFYDDYTGSSLDRPGLTQARQWLKAGKADVIIALDSDRLTREPAHYMRLRDEFNQHGIELHYAKRGQVNLNDFGQMLVEDFYGRFAHEWKRKLVENCTDGRREKAEQGHVVTHGQPPYGYTEQLINGKNTLVIDESEADIVRLIFFLYAYEDKGYNLIAQSLTEAGIPTRADVTKYTSGKKRGKCEWSIASIRRILTRQTYIGKWHYAKNSDNPIEVEVPAIIDQDTWQAVQRKRRANRGGRLGARHEYLVSGRGQCACCQSRISGQSCKWQSANSNGLILYYRCNAALQSGKVGITCNAPNFRGEKIDNAVWEWVKGLLLEPEKLQAGLEEYQAQQAGKAAP